MVLTVRDLGVLNGDVLLFGGLYSNKHALDALQQEAERLGIEVSHRVFTGDAMAYCANPAECWVALRDHFGPAIAGNCEKQIAAGEDVCGCGFEEGSACDLASRTWFPFTAARLAAVRDEIAACPDILTFIHAQSRYAVIHGGVSDVARFIWPDSDLDTFRQEIELLRAAVGQIGAVICGHCGIAFDRQIDDVRWINAGVIGMPPHDGRQETRYAVLSEDGVRFSRLAYDAGAAAAAMLSDGLTQGYEDSLLSGYWPSEDVLPASLRRWAS